MLSRRPVALLIAIAERVFITTKKAPSAAFLNVCPGEVGAGPSVTAKQRLVRYPSPVQGPQGLAWDGASMWLTSAANGRLYGLDPGTWNIRHEFVPPHESLGVTYSGSDFRLILAPAIDEPDLERDRRYVYSFTPDAGFTECFPCPDFSGSFLAYANGTLYLSQAWDKKLIELDEAGAPVREVQLERRPVGMTIVDGAFYLATVG